MKDITRKDLEQNIPLVASKDVRLIKAGNHVLGCDGLTIIAGPCTVESRSQIMEIACAIKDAGADMLRGGVFKPMTFPYGDPLAQPDCDSGLPSVDRKKILSKREKFIAAERRLGYLKEAGVKYGLPVISEVLYSDSVPWMEQYVDMFQMGHRHMFNMDLIEALSVVKKPLMIKRHYGESLRSLLGIAEYFETRGKRNFVLCERGVSVPHTHNLESRSIMDVQAIVALKEHVPTVPIFADPSHATFKRSYVLPIAKAAIGAGADGLIIEVHNDPDKAWVDPLQALPTKDFSKMVKSLRKVWKVAKADV